MKRTRAAVTPITAAAAVVIAAIVLGAGGYYAGSSMTSAVTVTSTVTTGQTVPAGAIQFVAYGGGLTQTGPRLVVDTGKAQGFYSANGLAPQWLEPNPALTFTTYPSLITVGAVVGIGPMSDALLAQANGAPIQIVGAFAGAPATTTFFALSNSSVKSGASLAGKTVGVVAANRAAATWLVGAYYAKRMGINFTMVLEGNATNAVAALTSGKTDAMLGGISPLMPAGQIVTIVDPNSIWATPFAGSAIWATNSVIQQNPNLVKAFVKATLASVSYLSSNPTYAANLYVSDFQGTPLFVLPASSSIANLNLTPSGTGGGTDLLTGVTNAWQFYEAECTGTCNAGMNVASGVDASFLP